MSVHAPGRLVTTELPITGMDCQDEANAIEAELRKLPGVRDLVISVSGARATVSHDPAITSQEQIRAAVARTGCSVAAAASREEPRATREMAGTFGWAALGLVAAVVLAAAVAERFGLLDSALDVLPWWVPAAAVLLGGWRIFRNVAVTALRGRVISHTLMTAGVIAAAAIGQWTTAALIVFFMRLADHLEDLTTARSRRALEALLELQPLTARVMREGREVEIPAEQVIAGDVMAVRPGERIPADGQVTEGHAPVDQAPITGESVPVDRGPGDPVFAATVALAGFLRIRATKVGTDTTFARIVKLVEEAEARKSPVQRFADRFSAYYLPAVLLIALATFVLTGQILNAVAVLVVACSCAITLATPVVVLASVGNAARRGLLIKGGIVLEQLARIDTVALDKTGTVTFGRPVLTDIVPLRDIDETGLLNAVAAVESRSEHPLARAIVRGAMERGVHVADPTSFEVFPGRGVVGAVGGSTWCVGNRRLLADRAVPIPAVADERAREIEAAGRTVFFAADGTAVAGLLAVADTTRPDVRAALDELRALGVRRIVMLTGDSERVAAAIAAELGIEHRADLLPEQKLEAIRALQAEGCRVLMVGDGVNDAPALAQADVGAAMGVAGTDVALEAADVALMRDDWRTVPETIRLGRRAAGTIRQNLAFAAVYNVVGITLAFLGILPPVWAAAAQSIPDGAIMLNSARLVSAGTPQRAEERTRQPAEA